MQPRTFAIVAFALLAGSVGLRFLVVHFGLLPISEEVVLKKAVAVTLTYWDKGQIKTLCIDEPEQLSELLATLHMDDLENTRFGGSKSALWLPAVTFQFSNGMTRSHAFDAPQYCGDYVVDVSFFNKLQKLVSVHERHNVDFLAQPVWGDRIEPPAPFDPDLKSDWKK